tara:strand:+ start:362 stop:676 length:315 start_codon:yes stop_codon:yes gene_type:complete
MVKLKHPQPAQYRVRYVLHNSAIHSTNYFSVFHSSETLVDLLHVLNKKNIKGRDINILSIEEFCPYKKIWIDRTKKAVKNIDSTELVINGSSILLNSNVIAETA